MLRNADDKCTDAKNIVSNAVSGQSSFTLYPTVTVFIFIKASPGSSFNCKCSMLANHS